MLSFTHQDINLSGEQPNGGKPKGDQLTDRNTNSYRRADAVLHTSDGIRTNSRSPKLCNFSFVFGMIMLAITFQGATAAFAPGQKAWATHRFEYKEFIVEIGEECVIIDKTKYRFNGEEEEQELEIVEWQNKKLVTYGDRSIPSKFLSSQMVGNFNFKRWDERYFQDDQKHIIRLLSGKHGEKKVRKALIKMVDQLQCVGRQFELDQQ